MNSGYLSIEARLASDGYPIENAKVYIVNTEGVGEVSDTYYTYYLTTDSSGNTGFIRIDTPDVEASTNINSEAIPYSVVDVYVTAEGYYPTRIKNVQVFPATQSVLPITLIPIAQGYAGTDKGTINIDIPKSILQSSDTHNMSGPSANQAEALISEEIYIPEFITVHLGTPSSNSPNVTVPFTEYIKNVASSEIYPTWPEESLRANIIAIISLTLNRFFTEWYRSQGYDFDITSTTAYDQFFAEGRNVFENISRIVDEIFNTYVTREGFINPLFTTFCDGKTVSCNGLSQWGSVELANRGENALGILKYYYGDNINLRTADDVFSAQSSYPGTPLSLGDSGEDVLTIQNQLMRIKQNYPAIPTIPTIDGNFGSSTDQAVRTFQEVFDLAVDGIVGKATWYKISYVYSSVTRLAETLGEGISEISPEEVPNVTIRLGDTGEYVLLLQRLINYISIFYTSVPSVIEDSAFGSATQAAVTQFQRTFGINQSGIVTPAVWDVFYRVYIDIINSVTPSLPNQGFPGDLRRGDRGENVRLIQSYLNVVSKRYPSIPTLSEDGFFGQTTETAVLNFQRDVGLPQTGVIDVSTWERIVELYNFEEA